MINDLILSKIPKAIVLFSAPHRSGCGLVDRIAKEMIKIHEDIQYINVDTTTKAGNVFAKKHGVWAIPTLMFFESGVLTYNITGIDLRSEYEKEIEEFALTGFLKDNKDSS